MLEHEPNTTKNEMRVTKSGIIMHAECRVECATRVGTSTISYQPKAALTTDLEAE